MHNCEKPIHICIQLRQRPLYAVNWRQRGQCGIFVMRACGHAPMLISVSEIAPSRICVPNMRPCYIPALHYGAGKGHEAVARLLLEKGADVAAREEDGWPALHGAADKGHEAVARLLLEKGADVVARREEDGSTALHQAAGNGHEAVARLLLEKGADVAAQSKGESTALHGAAGKGHEAVARLLLEKGADVAARTKDGRT